MISISVSSFIFHCCVDLIQLKIIRINILLSGFNDASLENKYSVNESIRNEDKSYIKSLDFLVVSKITTDLTPYRKTNLNMNEFTNIKLADY